jgi:hypothetical protein
MCEQAVVEVKEICCFQRIIMKMCHSDRYLLFGYVQNIHDVGNVHIFIFVL